MNHPRAETPGNQAGLWQTVRRALGRLVSATSVRELPTGGLTASFPAPEGLVLRAPAPGTAETRWRPEADVAALAPPQAWAGPGEADLSPVVTVAGLHGTLPPASGVVHPAGLPSSACTVHRLDATDVLRQTPAVQSSPMLPGLGRVAEPNVRFAAPGNARLPIDAPVLVREPRLRRPGRRSRADDLLQLAGGRVRLGASLIAGVPMVRDRRPAPKGMTATDAYSSERECLARSAGVPPSDVVLLGVFPQVPVAAVRRLALEEGGALSLWLKPEALAAAAAGKTPRLATLIVGRQRSTGRMI